MHDERGGSRWVAIVALAFVAGGIGLAAWQWRGEATAVRRGSGSVAETLAAPAQAGLPVGEPDEEAIEQALRLTPGYNGRAIKERWVDLVQGVDVSDLAPAMQEVFLRAANSRYCTCGCGYTLAGCRSFDPDCEVSLPRVEALLDSVRGGKLNTADGLRARPRG